MSYFERRIKNLVDIKEIKKEYKLLKKLMQEFHEYYPNCISEISYYIIRIFCVIPYNIYEKDCQELWSKVLSYIVEPQYVLYITDYILYSDKLNEYLNMWKQPELILKILAKIIKKGRNKGKLNEILKKMQSQVQHIELEKNDNYKYLKNL